MTSHFFLWVTGKEFVRDNLKTLEVVQTTFKRMPCFFNDDNIITTLVFSSYRTPPIDRVFVD